MKKESYSDWREEISEIYNEPNAQYKDLKGRNQDTSPAGGLRYTRPSTQPPVKKDPLTGLPLASAGTGPKLKPGSGLGGGVPVYPKGSKQPAPTGAKLPPLRLAHYEPEGEIVSEGKPYQPGDTIPDSATKPQIKKKPKFSVDKTGLEGPENPLGEETKKDACYKKVKARYDVWPSAYASGALVKCRKVGAANWGNKTKKEGYEFSNWRDDFVPTEIETTDLITPDPIQVPPPNLQKIEEKCWVGYKQLGMKKKGKKMVPNCVPEHTGIVGKILEQIAGEEELQTLEEKNVPTNPSLWSKMKSRAKAKFDVYPSAYANGWAAKEYKKAGGGWKSVSEEVELEEAVRIPAKTGNLMHVMLTWKGKIYSLKMFFPQVSTPSRKDVQDQIEKVYPGSRVQSYHVTEYQPGEPIVHTEGAAWTRKEGQNKEGGLNEKGRKSYERENPGSDLKAPSKKVGNPRRKSFCARMSGMKKKLTSSKTANDPNSRINKSLRAWNC